MQEIDERRKRGIEPYEELVGKEEFARPYNNVPKEFSPLRFDEMAYVPRRIAEDHLAKMEGDMKKMQDSYKGTLRVMEDNYAQIENQLHQHYKRVMSDWKERAQTKLQEYKTALAASVADNEAMSRDATNKIATLRKEVKKLSRENEVFRESAGDGADVVENLKELHDKEIEEREREISNLRSDNASLEKKLAAAVAAASAAASAGTFLASPEKPEEGKQEQVEKIATEDIEQEHLQENRDPVSIRDEGELSLKKSATVLSASGRAGSGTAAHDLAALQRQIDSLQH